MFARRASMGISIGVLASLVGALPAAALTQKECSEKYQAAKAAGTLGDKSWDDFRKTECAANAAATTEPATKPPATTVPAAALTQKECSEKYQAAKAAGTLGDKSWNDFRKTECAANAAATTTAPETKPAKEPEKNATKSAAKQAVFPSAVSSKYAKQSAGKARMHTCLDQYNANKAANANGGLKWIMKGGGYYSECNKRLKS
jgi:hypothetical protein